VILSRIFCCKPIPVATETSIITTLIATAAIAIFIIGAETLFLYFLEVANRLAIKYDKFKAMKSKILFKNTFLFFFVIIFTCLSLPSHSQIKTGTDQSEKYLPLLKDKKVGILTNQTGILTVNTNKTRECSQWIYDTETIHLVDFLIDNKVN